MGEKNRYWRLTRRPIGDDYASALDLVEEETPDLVDGDVLIRNTYLSLDAGTRMWMTAREDSYSPPTPLGCPVIGMVLGEVIASRHPDFREGDLVRAYGQWSDFSVSRPDETYVERVSRRLDDVRQHLAVFGPNGWTGYLGVAEYGAAKAGDTFVVSAASGVTGALAGQVAARLGCRVIGITGSAEKAAWITEDWGFDAAVNRQDGDVAEQLRTLCPDGIDLYFDNVGGEILDAALENMALFGRVAICGLLTSYGEEGPIPGPYKFDQVLMKRLNFTGFFSPDFYHRGPDVNRRLRPWYEAGDLRMTFDVTDGLENTLTAYSRLLSGAKIGKSLVRLGNAND
ncbi:NADP-dependent oxidoreductase [Actinoallomurus vinaceus]|uniref:NADP-dependent oxidoreductase n=1 Tax=Actinoallomurus vinaceus TaxID=1080074 RepID=A0ABP8U1N8_9ACTN